MPLRRNELVTCVACGVRFVWSKLKREVICPSCNEDNAGPQHYGSIRREKQEQGNVPH